MRKGTYVLPFTTYRNDPLENQVISEFRWVRIKRKSGSILLDNQHRPGSIQHNHRDHSHQQYL